MSNTPFNAYELLDIYPNATDFEIKKAFKLKAQELHPDKYQNAKPANILFNILVQAKDILLNPKERLAHDYAHGIKKKPKLAEESINRNHYETSTVTDWGTLILAGVAGLVIGATILSGRKKK